MVNGATASHCSGLKISVRIVVRFFQAFAEVIPWLLDVSSLHLLGYQGKLELVWLQPLSPEEEQIDLKVCFSPSFVSVDIKCSLSSQQNSTLVQTLS